MFPFPYCQVFCSVWQSAETQLPSLVPWGSVLDCIVQFGRHSHVLLPSPWTTTPPLPITNFPRVHTEPVSGVSDAVNVSSLCRPLLTLHFPASGSFSQWGDSCSGGPKRGSSNSTFSPSMNTQELFSLEMDWLVSLQSKGRSQSKRSILSTQRPTAHHTWPLENS